MSNQSEANNGGGKAAKGGGRIFWMRLGICLASGVLMLLAARLFFPLKSLKQIVLEKQNAALMEKIEYISDKTNLQAERLEELQMRDNTVYRPIFGMDEIPAELRNEGYSFQGRYDSLQRFANADFLTRTIRRQDIIEKKTAIQSRSFDDIEKVAAHLEDMSRSIPTLFPVCPAGVTITSPFGYRLHPIFQSVFFHSGTDIAGQRGMPVYSAADGVVTEAKTSSGGYGNEVNIDHGFGYSTRYAHLNTITVVPGQVVSRGDQVGTMGSSGRATGVHLHYEVLYKSQQVNPRNFFDSKIDTKTYMTQVRLAEKKVTK